MNRKVGLSSCSKYWNDLIQSHHSVSIKNPGIQPIHYVYERFKTTLVETISLRCLEPMLHGPCNLHDVTVTPVAHAAIVQCILQIGLGHMIRSLSI